MSDPVPPFTETHATGSENFAHAKNYRNAELDFLRGIAILITFFAHVQAMRHPNYLNGFFSMTWGLGVDIFFVLSGYLITKSLISSLRARTPRSVLRQFWIKRFFRIVPTSMFWLIIAVTVAALLSAHSPGGIWSSLRSGAAAALNVMNVYYSYCSAINEVDRYCGGMWTLGVWWSLSLEEQFYIVFPLLLVFFRPRYAAATVFLVYAFYVLQEKSAWNWAMATKLDGICVGVMLAIYEKNLRSFDFGGLSRFEKKLLGFSLLCILWLVSNSGAFLLHQDRAVFASTIVCCGIVVFIASRQEGFFEFGFASSLLQRLGRISFSFYLCHQIVIVFSVKLFAHFGYEPTIGQFLVYSLFAFSLSAAIAKSSFVLLEQPLTDIGQRKAASVLQ